MSPQRPRVPRETRQLVLVIIAAIATLWVLARIRFPDRPALPNPVPSVLAQLAPRPALQDIADSMAGLASRLGPSLVGFEAEPSTVEAGGRTVPALALRFRDDLAVALLARGGRPIEPAPSSRIEVIRRDPVSHLALVRVPATDAIPALSVWSAPGDPLPSVLIAADANGGDVAPRPAFVGAVRPAASAAWSGDVWALSPSVDLPEGTFVFTTDGILAGLAIDRPDGPALVPGTLVLADAERLAVADSRPPGRLGIAVQTLTRELASALGASSGVVVTWVDPRGPAARDVIPSDVIEDADHQPLSSPDDWSARTGRLAEGEAIVIGVRRNGERREVRLVAQAPPGTAVRPLGLTLRAALRAGVEVLRVDVDSAAARAGLRPGDVITVADGRAALQPADVLRAFAAARPDRPAAIAFTRGVEHRVTTLEKVW